MKLVTVVNYIKGLRKNKYYSRFIEIFRPIKYEQEPFDLIKKREIFYKKFIKPNDLVFDVGANVGNRILPFINIGARVIAFEPQKKCRKILNKRFGKNITVVKNGVSNKIEKRTFYISNANTLSSFSKKWIDSVKNNRFNGLSWSPSEEVSMITLDLAISKYGKPSFIKIDVEGFELEVLEGLNEVINFISFEYTTPEQNIDAINCVNKILSLESTATFNYSIGESMDFKFNNWINGTQMIEHIKSFEFEQSGFGDIYASLK